MKKKDPAFLFYSNKFYEGTRTLLPEERACLVDLMIYQHQRGIIPDDPKRVAMYCNGISEATLQATLEAKFKRVDGGWISETMCEVMDDRKEYAEKQAVNGRIGQFWKKAKAILSAPEYKRLRVEFLGLDLQETHSIISEIQPTKEGLKGWLKQRLSKTLKDVDVIKDEDTVVIEDTGRGNARGETGTSLDNPTYKAKLISRFGLTEDDFTYCLERHKLSKVENSKVHSTAEQARAAFEGYILTYVKGKKERGNGVTTFIGDNRSPKNKTPSITEMYQEP